MISFKKWIGGVFVFLVGCSTVKTPAGPICISCKPYYCRGSWHRPQTYYEYDQIGLASWYGDDFHGKAKASGEKFNKMAMTAAHKTLPIPSVVRVTNLRNGRTIVVVVDDRGPFHYQGRIIDLSYAAAKVLNLHKCKPSKVRVQTLVADSLKLSQYIRRYCKKRRDPFGRSWDQLYFQEIKGSRMPVYSETSFPASHIDSVPQKKQNTADTNKKKRRNLGSYLNRIYY
ncbi:MAG: septal ring lytic transglycosylase RlpA family protein [Holosporales bacterium]|jgi:rare lipoprotein A (peptidoglycan hydrolase)|nr:septal ring lytic transglycosylase RlpA family protein [Holosporales bacterium]